MALLFCTVLYRWEVGKTYQFLNITDCGLDCSMQVTKCRTPGGGSKKDTGVTPFYQEKKKVSSSSTWVKQKRNRPLIYMSRDCSEKESKLFLGSPQRRACPSLSSFDRCTCF